MRQQRPVTERSGVADGELTSSRHEREEGLYVTRDPVGDVQPRRRDRMEPRSLSVDAERPSHGARRIGECSLGGINVGVGEDSCAQSLARHGFVAVQREIGDHLDAAPSKRGRKRLCESLNHRIGSQQFDTKVTRPRRRHGERGRCVGAARPGLHRNRTGREFVVKLVGRAEEDDDVLSERSSRERSQQLRFALGEDDLAVVQRNDVLGDVVAVPRGGNGESATFVRETDQRAGCAGAEHAGDEWRGWRCGRGGRKRFVDVEHAVETIANQRREVTNQFRVPRAQQFDRLVDVEVARFVGLLTQQVASPLGHEREGQASHAADRGRSMGSGGGAMRVVKRDRDGSRFFQGCV